MSKKNKIIKNTPLTNKIVQKVLGNMQNQQVIAPENKINVLAWGATPYVITGFGVVMKELLSNLFRMFPGQYEWNQVAINYHGDFCDEFAITGESKNGRFRQWPAASAAAGRTNLYGQGKFLDVLRQFPGPIDFIFLFEDPFWVGGTVPDVNPPVYFIDAIRQILAQKGMGHVPIVAYFPIDGIPKKSWIQNIAKCDIPITYLPFGAMECLKAVPELSGRLGVIHHGVNTQEFFPVSKDEARQFKRAMFGDKYADRYMFLNVNRNQLRKLIPSSLIAFKAFKEKVPDSFCYLNMKMQDVGWDISQVCDSLGLRLGLDVMLPPDFNVNKGLSIEDLNLVFNAANCLFTSATGGGWELALSQAFATKTPVLAPANTAHTDLCGPQDNENERRGVLYKSGSNLAQQAIFPYDNEVVRPLPDLDDMVEKMLWMYSNQDKVNQITENAYKWVNNSILWDKHIVPQFHKAFTIAKSIGLKRLQDPSRVMQKHV